MDCGESTSNELPIVLEEWIDPTQEWLDMILPVTIFQIKHNVENITNKPKGFMMDGRKYGGVSDIFTMLPRRISILYQALVTAQVASVESNGSASMDFRVEDGTGSIRAHRDLTSVKLEQSAEHEEAEREACLAL